MRNQFKLVPGTVVLTDVLKAEQELALLEAVNILGLFEDVR